MKEAIGYKKDLLAIVRKLAYKYELSKTVGDDYYEPDMMENLDQYMGEFSEKENTVVLRMEAKGLRYDNRTGNLEDLSVGDQVDLVRDYENPFNSNNFKLESRKGQSLGNCPAEFCNALAPLYDYGYATVLSTTVSYLEKIKERSRYAKQGIMFFEVRIKLKGV